MRPVIIFVQILAIAVLTSTAVPKKNVKNIRIKSNSEVNPYNIETKSKECLDREKAIEIINLYKSFRNLTKDLFALTREEANNFRNLIPVFEEKRKPPVKPCKRKLPKFGECKFQEIAYILNSTQCLVPNEEYEGAHARRPADEEEKQVEEYNDPENLDYSDDDDANDANDEDDDDDEYNRKRRYASPSRSRRSTDSITEDDEKRLSRKRRALQPAQVITHEDGSITQIRACVDRKSPSENGHLRIVRECAATTTLPDNKFPRFLNEVLCDFSDTNCFQNEGVNIQRVIQVTFREDKNRTRGVAQLGEWEQYTQSIKTSCGCQMKSQSLLSGFV